MTRPSLNATIVDLYLVFCQAKTALYVGKRGVGLLELAEYEWKLSENLQAKGANEKCFRRCYRWRSVLTCLSTPLPLFPWAPSFEPQAGAGRSRPSTGR